MSWARFAFQCSCARSDCVTRLRREALACRLARLELASRCRCEASACVEVARVAFMTPIRRCLAVTRQTNEFLQAWDVACGVSSCGAKRVEVRLLDGWVQLENPPWDDFGRGGLARERPRSRASGALADTCALVQVSASAKHERLHRDFLCRSPARGGLRDQVRVLKDCFLHASGTNFRPTPSLELPAHCEFPSGPDFGPVSARPLETHMRGGSSWCGIFRGWDREHVSSPDLQDCD